MLKFMQCYVTHQYSLNYNYQNFNYNISVAYVVIFILYWIGIWFQLYYFSLYNLKISIIFENIHLFYVNVLAKKKMSFIFNEKEKKKGGCVDLTLDCGIQK